MDVDIKKTVGQRLHLLRVERNLTQEQMGEMLNLSTSAYCKIEYGETDLTLTRLNKIAEIFKISAAELFCKIDGSRHPGAGIPGTGDAHDAGTTQTDNYENLRDLIKTNSRLIELLYRKVEALEERMPR